MSDSTAQHAWWGSVPGASIEQGDLLQGFEVLVPLADASDIDEIQVEWHRFNLVVMTQTCDIEHGKVRSLLLCPWWDLWDFIDAATAKGENWGREVRENLRRGNIPGYHLLNEADQGGIGIGLVDFHEVYSAPNPAASRVLEGTPPPPSPVPTLPGASCTSICEVLHAGRPACGYSPGETPQTGRIGPINVDAVFPWAAPDMILCIDFRGLLLPGGRLDTHGQPFGPLPPIRDNKSPRSVPRPPALQLKDDPGSETCLRTKSEGGTGAKPRDRSGDTENLSNVSPPHYRYSTCPVMSSGSRTLRPHRRVAP